MLCFKENSHAYFLSTTDSVVRFELNPGYYLECGNSQDVAGMNYRNYVLHYTLTDEIIEKLPGFEVAGMRFYATNTYVEFEKLKGPRKKEQIKTFFNDYLKCIE